MSNWIISPDKHLTEDEVKQLRKTLQDAATLARARGSQMAVRDQLIIELALGTGLRVSELANLQVKELFLKKGQNSLHVHNGKDGKDRIVQFSTGLKKLILDYLEYRKSDSPYLFPSKRGEQMTRFGISQVFKQWAQRAELPATIQYTAFVTPTLPTSIRHLATTFGWFNSSWGIRASRQPLCTVLW